MMMSTESPWYRVTDVADIVVQFTPKVASLCALRATSQALHRAVGNVAMREYPKVAAVSHAGEPHVFPGAATGRHAAVVVLGVERPLAPALLAAWFTGGAAMRETARMIVDGHDLYSDVTNFETFDLGYPAAPEDPEDDPDAYMYVPAAAIPYHGKKPQSLRLLLRMLHHSQRYFPALSQLTFGGGANIVHVEAVLRAVAGVGAPRAGEASAAPLATTTLTALSLNVASADSLALIEGGAFAKLQHLRVEFSERPMDLSRVPASLQSLCLCGDWVVDALPSLPRESALESLTARYDDGWEIHDSHGATLAHLRGLHYLDFGAQARVDSLHAALAPTTRVALRRLHVRVREHNGPMLLEVLRCFPDLERLDVTEAPQDGEEPETRGVRYVDSAGRRSGPRVVRVWHVAGAQPVVPIVEAVCAARPPSLVHVHFHDRPVDAEHCRQRLAATFGAQLTHSGLDAPEPAQHISIYGEIERGMALSELREIAEGAVGRQKRHSLTLNLTEFASAAAAMELREVIELAPGASLGLRARNDLPPSVLTDVLPRHLDLANVTVLDLDFGGLMNRKRCFVPLPDDLVKLVSHMPVLREITIAPEAAGNRYGGVDVKLLRTLLQRCPLLARIYRNEDGIETEYQW